MSIEKISLRLTGVGPMLMRNSRLGDPLRLLREGVGSGHVEAPEDRG